jgi:hypothetical protein
MAKATPDKKWAVFFNNPSSPGWDFWGASNTAEAAHADVLLCRNRGYQAFKVLITFPPMKKKEE